MDYIKYPSSFYQKLTPKSGEGFFWVSDLLQEIPIKMRDFSGDVPPRTLLDFLDHNLLTYLSLKITEGLGNSGHEAFAKSLVQMQIPERSTIGIIGFNSPHWFISYCGSLYANCVPVGIYQNSLETTCVRISEHSECKVLSVQNAKILQSFSRIINNFNSVVVWQASRKLENFPDNVIAWQKFLEIGQQLPAEDTQILDRRKNIFPGLCATVIYTSGTGGEEKGAMLSHDNLVYTAFSTIKHLEPNIKIRRGERVISYLPLNHIAAQMMDLILHIVAQGTTYFADEELMKNAASMVKIMKQVEPTVFFAVPAIWEQLMIYIKTLISKQSRWNQFIFNWSYQKGNQSATKFLANQNPVFGFSIADQILFTPLKQDLGFTACKLFVSGAAPISQEIVQFFMSLNIFIMNTLGMSESSAIISMNAPEPLRFKPQSCGKNLSLIQIKVQVPDTQQEQTTGTVGEILFKGRNVFMGYLKDSWSSQQIFDSDGFLRTGDLGFIDHDGFLFITGRRKEIIITLGGENIIPQQIQPKIIELCPILSQVFIIGDGKKYLSALLCIKCKMDENKNATNELTDTVKSYLQQVLKIQISTLHQALENDQILAFIDKKIEEYNLKHAFSNVYQVRRWKILEKDFSIRGGELTPTLKVRRTEVLKKFYKEIEALYIPIPTAKI